MVSIVLKPSTNVVKKKQTTSILPPTWDARQLGLIRLECLSCGCWCSYQKRFTAFNTSSHAHTLPCRRRPDARHLFGDSRRSDSLDSSQNPLQFQSAATPERATNTILCATAAVFVPSSPAARALLFRNKSSFQTSFTGLDNASLHTDTPTLTPYSSTKTELLQQTNCDASLRHGPLDPIVAPAPLLDDPEERYG
jgi:hypothetical protein